MVLLNVCENVAALKILLFFKSLLKIIFIMGPILVIIFSAVSFFKVVMSGDAKDFNKSFIILLKRLIACAAIFFLPTIVNVIINDLLKSMASPDITDRKSTRLNSSHIATSRMPSSA